jgi:hypothetical protein
MRIKTMMIIAAVSGAVLTTGAVAVTAQAESYVQTASVEDAALCVALSDVSGLGGARYDTADLEHSIESLEANRGTALSVRTAIADARRSAREAEGARSASETQYWRDQRDAACAPFRA